MDEQLKTDLIQTLERLKDVVSNNQSAMTTINTLIAKIQSQPLAPPGPAVAASDRRAEGRDPGEIEQHHAAKAPRPRKVK